MLIFLHRCHQTMKRKLNKITLPVGRYSFRRIRNLAESNEGKSCRSCVSGTAFISKQILILSESESATSRTLTTCVVGHHETDSQPVPGYETPPEDVMLH